MNKGDNRGFVTVKTLVFLYALSFSFLFIIDIAFVYAVKVSSLNGLNLALRGAANQVDRQGLADPVDPKVYILPGQAQDQFYEYLEKNLRLNRGLNPQKNSIADSTVSVEYFKILNEGELPFTYNHDGYVETITQPSAVGIIRVPVRLSAFGQLIMGQEFVDVRVHSTVAPEIVGEHFEDWSQIL